MSQFLQRNKKKGLLAALLLLLQRGKGTGPVVLMLAIISSVFILPPRTIGWIPFFGPAILKMRGGPAGADLSGLSAQLEESRGSRRLASPGALFGPDGGGRYGRSTMELVKGEPLPGHGEILFDGVAKGAGSTVGGVLRPEDAKKLEKGLPLTGEELISGLTNPAAAGFLSGGAGAGAARGAAPTSGIRAAGEAPLVASALENTSVPNVGAARPRGSGGGKLGDRNFRRATARLSGALGAARGAGNGTVMYQLAAGRAYSVAAAPPPGKCDPAKCPNEYAASASGVPFDGNEARGGFLTAAQLGDVDPAGIPSDGEISSLLDQAAQMERDATACHEANETYGPIVDQKNAAIQKTTDDINAICTGGGCSSNASTCKRLAAQLRTQCQEHNAAAQQWANACPMTQGNFDAHDCNQ